MSDQLAAKVLRQRFKAAIQGAGIVLSIDGRSVPVTVMDKPPKGWQVPEESLPAVYVFNSGERITPSSLESQTRALALDVVLMARASGGDPGDQLDDLQLEIERAVIGSRLLDGAADRLDLASVSIGQEQGRTLFGVRLMGFEAATSVTADDPSF